MSFMTWVAATLSCVLLLVADVRFHSSCEERAAYVLTSLRHNVYTDNCAIEMQNG